MYVFNANGPNIFINSVSGAMPLYLKLFLCLIRLKIPSFLLSVFLKLMCSSRENVQS